VRMRIFNSVDAAHAAESLEAGPVGRDGVGWSGMEWDGSVDVSFDPDEFFEKDGNFLALVPWADALNHDVDAGAEAVLSYNPRTGFAELRASTSFKLGAEVFGSYEPGITRSELFLNYGYVAANTTAKLGEQSGDLMDVSADVAKRSADVVDFPGDEFWADIEAMLAGAAGAAGDRDRQSFAALGAYLTAVGMGPAVTGNP